MGNRPGHLRLSQTRQSNHPLILGAALSILATALPSSAFAATTGYSTAVRLLNHYPFGTKPLLVRGGGGNRHQRGGSSLARMSNEGGYSKAPPPEPKISPFSRPIKKVTIVGGTHGNEYTGVWCIKVIEKQRETYNNKRNNGDGSSKNNNLNVFEEFTSFDIDTLLGNPVAHLENKRFVDVDLNREFSMEKLQRVPVDGETIEEECDIRNEFCSNGNVESLPHEAVRAREIELLLGPKFNKDGNTPEDHDSDPNSCVVVDLHTTTANMGISLIIPEGDALMSAAAAYVMHKCKEKYGDDETQCLMHALPKRQDRMNLSSCGRHGFTIEVGPTPQGVLRHDVVEKTQTAMHALMEFLHLRNLELANNATNNSDEEMPPSILDQLKTLYPGGIVPCYRSAPAVRPGELSGKISWPNDESNPNFPALMVHQSVQDRDFAPLRVGDPLFVDLDGRIIPYDGSHGEEVHLIFVNEGGYYYASSGTGIGVAVKSNFDWSTGWFVVESDEVPRGGYQEVTMEVEDSYE